MIKLPRLGFNYQDQPQLLSRYWNTAMGTIEGILNELLAIPEIADAVAAAQTAANTAQTAAATAQTAADTAQAVADGAAVDTAAQQRETSIVNSYVTSYTAPLIKVSSAGLVTIANHSRAYGDSVLNPTVAVTGAAFATTGVATDVIRVYYDDPTRAGGAVTYLYTIDPAAFPVQGGDRHSVGAVTVPGAGTQNGNGVNPPGYAIP